MSSLSAKPDQKLTIRNHKGTLSEFFKEIEKQSDYRFFYNDELVRIEKEVYQLDVNNKSVDEVLTSLLAYTGLKYKKLDNNLIVISTSELLENINVTGSVTDASGEPVIGANVIVKGTTIGTTTDADGNFTLSVPNNDAVLAFSYIGYATQEIKVGRQRTFRIVLQEDNMVLDEVVVVAYGTAKKKDLTGAVSTVDAKTITTQAHSSISSALEGAVAGLQVAAQEGQPGMDMTIRVRGLGSSNESASNALVVIDGVPMQYANVLTSINPNDISSVTVLKDAASTALYGSRGANGVVLVTTKKGTSGKAKISFDARWGVNTMTNNMPDLVRDPAAIYEHTWLLNYNTYRYSDGVTYQTNGYTNFAQNPLHTHEEAALFASQHLFNYMGSSQNLTRNQLGNWMLYSFPGWNDESNYERMGSGTSETATMLNNYLVGTDGKLNPQAQLLYNDTYYDNLLKNRIRQEYNVSVGGGSDKIDYHVSLGYLSDPSYIETSSFDRYTGRAVLNGQLTNWLKVGANTNYTYRITNGQPANYSEQGLALRTGMSDSGHNIFSVVNGEIPIMQLYAHDKDGNYIYNPDGSRKVFENDGDGESWVGPTASDPWGNLSGNVLKRMELDKNELTSHYLTTRTYAEVKFLNYFTFTTNLAVDAAFDNVTRYLNNETGGGVGAKGGLNKQSGSNVNLNLQQLLNYNRDFDRHHVDAMIGHEYNQYSYEDIKYTSTYSLIPGFPAYANFVGVYTGERGHHSGVRYEQPGGDIWKEAMESYLAKANYIYDNRYGVSASLRRDGSSKFKNSEDRWGTFWSIGGSWRLSSEEFIKSTDAWLNNLKLRGSYGVLGNQNGLGHYATYQTWLLGASYDATAAGSAYYNQPGYQQTPGGRVPNSFLLNQGNKVYENLTWENIHTLDIGVDIDIFNRVHATFDWYNRETVNAFYANTLSTAAEAFALTTSQTMNNAKIRNRGFEIDLNIDIVRTRDLYWSIGANGTHFNTILSKMPDGQGSETLGGNQAFGNSYLCYLRGEGKPYWGTYLYKYEGPDPNTGVPLYHHKVTAADKDANRFGGAAVGTSVKTANISLINANDRVECGDALPDWIGGFNTTLRYKNIDFGAVISYQVGGKFFWQDGIYYYESDFGRDRPIPISTDLIGNTWTPENPNAKFPIAMHNRSYASAYGISVEGSGPSATTDLLLFSASYFNVKNITLGYNLPKAWCNKAGLSNLRVYASGDNIYMKSAHKGIDPRMTLTGTPNATYIYPYLRVFNMGVNIEF
ncbi:MAG: TonB-dependent receptor [Tannerella sp.]|nr:TonB-dependent receptor [Tannerella sp.]